MMTCPSQNFQWNTNHEDASLTPNCRFASSAPSTQVTALERLHRQGRDSSPKKPTSRRYLGEEKESPMKAERRTRRRRRRQRNSGSPASSSKPRGILKKTSSYNGTAYLMRAAVRSGSPEESRRVSFPGMTSSRWDSQGSLSKSLIKSKCAMMPRRGNPQTKNFVWNTNPSASTTINKSQSLNSLSFALTAPRPIKEDRKVQAPSKPSRRVSVEPDALEFPNLFGVPSVGGCKASRGGVFKSARSTGSLSQLSRFL